MFPVDSAMNRAMARTLQACSFRSAPSCLRTHPTTIRRRCALWSGTTCAPWRTGATWLTKMSCGTPRWVFVPVHGQRLNRHLAFGVPISW